MSLCRLPVQELVEVPKLCSPLSPPGSCVCPAHVSAWYTSRVTCHSCVTCHNPYTSTSTSPSCGVYAGVILANILFLQLQTFHCTGTLFNNPVGWETSPPLPSFTCQMIIVCETDLQPSLLLCSLFHLPTRVESVPKKPLAHRKINSCLSG